MASSGLEEVITPPPKKRARVDATASSEVKSGLGHAANTTDLKLPIGSGRAGTGQPRTAKTSDSRGSSSSSGSKRRPSGEAQADMATDLADADGEAEEGGDDGQRFLVRELKADGVKKRSDMFRAHVESFNFMLEQGLELAVQGLSRVSLDANPELRQPALSWWISEASISKPVKDNSEEAVVRLHPNEARELGVSYSGKLTVMLERQVGDGPVERMSRTMGQVPIMVKSKRCYLHSLERGQLVAAREEETEQGGYFIINGLEKIMRLIVMPRRNTVLALSRPSWRGRGKHYSSFGCQMRCVRKDQSGKTLTLHYLDNGTCMLRFTMRKQEFFVPAVFILKALVDTTDEFIFQQLVAGNRHNAFVLDRAEVQLRAAQREQLQSQRQVLTWLGKTFRGQLFLQPSVSDEEAGRTLLRDYMFVHCEASSELARNRQKFDCLIYMIQKLYALADGVIQPDNPDATSSHEVLLPGHLYTMFLKEKLQDFLFGMRAVIQKDLRQDASKVELTKEVYWRKVFDAQGDVGRKLHYFISTGNLSSTTGMDLMQTSGFTVQADKLNFFRFLAHFRSLHRGQFFTTTKTTTVRKLLPESWGFVCPIHTPDGAPCGLLNHISTLCELVTHLCQTTEQLPRLLAEYGMVPQGSGLGLSDQHIPVILDGILVGRVSPQAAPGLVHTARTMRMRGQLPILTEIFAALNSDDGVFPTVSLFTGPGRMVRPVRRLPTASDKRSHVEWIGPMEQMFMEIAVRPEDFRPGETTHQELNPQAMLSEIASFTPFSDFNPSARNMFQCQMAKQTMGTPFHSFPHRVDNKVYRLQTPQRPIVRNDNYERFEMNDYPAGTNAVVAVISYTGYDMEDAMIVNKAAMERGFAHASVYKYEVVDLEEKRVRGEPIHRVFSNTHPDEKDKKTTAALASASGKKPQAAPSRRPRKKCAPLDYDGLPYVGQLVQPGEPLYSVYDDIERKFHISSRKDHEPCYVEEVRLLGGTDPVLQTVGLKMRINRNPVIGDKFSSRHGQKGVLSILWPQENMPFTESGITPDVIINPHAFPSRMTIGMLVESMAGKAGAWHGLWQDGTPFKFNETQRASDHFGEQLARAGFNYYGTEPMYSGVSGLEMQAEIYIGVVYYQRLRHMVHDKSQVRATGPINAVFKQPIKGRKVRGGIRFGEMERDSLLAHGTAYLLHDRLMNCSDYHTGAVCTQCGSILSPTVVSVPPQGTASLAQETVVCRTCHSGKHCTTIAMPYVFLYLVNELAAMNIRLSLDVQ